MFLVVGTRIAGRPIKPTEVWFTHPAPTDTTKHEKFFDCPVKFDADDTAIVFPADRLSYRLPKADAALKALLERVARQMLEQLPKTDSWTDRVRENIARELSEGNPTLDNIASQMGVAPRTLRRRLKEEGTTLTELLDELRHDLALRYLREDSLSLSEITYLLGFSEPSAFHRACKRWTGRSPAEIRNDAPPATPA